MGQLPRPKLTVFAPLACLLSTGCRPGSLPESSLDNLTREQGWLIVPGVRGIRQTGQADCGASALGMVLEYWGHGREDGEIGNALLSPGKRAIKVQALRDFARHDGLSAYIIQGHHNDLVSEISAGRPIVVGLWKDSVFGEFPHYEVIAGINPSTNLVLAFDPTHGWEIANGDEFHRQWSASGSVCLVISPHGHTQERTAIPLNRGAP